MASTRTAMKYFQETLSSPQFKLLKRLGPFLSGHGFYLAGGTAIALMLGHRKSVDLDWFSPVSIRDPASWTNKIKSAGMIPLAVNIDEGTFYATIGGVRISIIEYPYTIISPLVEWKSVGCSLASLDDLACMKLSAIASRGSKKDFIDVYALEKKHCSLQHMMSMYNKKFPEADLFPVFRGLSYFDDADNVRMPRMVWKVTWKTIKEEIQKELNKLIRKIEHLPAGRQADNTD
ncbi:MAG: nucleotidyl transferase AbiEii/AbiGii toxin family protein [bacterium]